MFYSKKKQQDFINKINYTKPIILSTIRKYLWQENIHHIDDVAQEVYFNAYRSLMKNQFRFQSKIETWLYAITKNQCLKVNKESFFKKCFSLNSIINDGEEKINQLPDDATFLKKEENKLSKKERKILIQIVDELPIKYREVISFVLDGYQEREIAFAMNIAVGTVKSRKHKAIQKLKFIAQRGNYELE